MICLFDGKVLNLPLGEVSVGRVTRGHRFLSKGEISVADAADYREKLAKAHVVLDWNERREIIAKGLGKLAGAEGLTAKPDDGLLDEVAGLVEYPVVLMGSIDADFVRPLPDGLPPEVLATAMRTHQKYFSCLSADGTPAPRFLFVANNVTADKGAAIVAGNERVLRARLSDAKFFWDQDRKVRLEDRVEALKQRVYHEKLGSVYDKTARLTDIANKIAVLVYPLDHELWARAERAAHLAKADLSAGMVGEFPELQGVMGGYYALTSGQPEDHRIATAIANHYKPLGPSDSCPSTPESLVVALADKIETLTGFFRIEEKPTGSRDPFALRRAALGMIRLILENGVRIPLRTAFYYGSSAFDPVRYGIFDLSSELLSFITDRLKVHLREQGIRSELIAATSTWGGLVEDDLVRLVQRVRTLEAFLATDDGENLLTAYRRASSIVEIEERRDDQRYNDAIAPLLFKQPEELNLGRSLEEIGGTAGALLLKERFAEAMRELAKLRRPIDEFFARVTVNTDDVKLRQNRLRLLAGIRTTMKQVADFSQIEG